MRSARASAPSAAWHQLRHRVSRSAFAEAAAGFDFSDLFLFTVCSDEDAETALCDQVERVARFALLYDYLVFPDGDFLERIREVFFCFARKV